MSNWIKCFDQMPKAGMVLVFQPRHCMFFIRLYGTDGHWYNDTTGTEIYADITHWQPLPSPPTPEEM